MNTENNIDKHVESEIIKRYLFDSHDQCDEVIEDLLLDSSFSCELDSILSEVWEKEEGIKNEETKKQILINIKGHREVPLHPIIPLTVFFRYAAAIIIITVATYTALHRDMSHQESIKSAAVTEVPQTKDTTPIIKKAPSTISSGLLSMADPKARKENEESKENKEILIKDIEKDVVVQAKESDAIAMAKESDAVPVTPRTHTTEITLKEDVTYTASQTIEIVLADGSNVTIQEGSSLSFSDFNDKVRKVTLNGEAFFAVTKSTIPFIVESNGMNIMVTGTEFTVDNYKKEEVAYITVNEGSVIAETPKGMKYGLSAGNEFSYDYRTMEAIVISRTSVPIKVTTPDNQSYDIEPKSQLKYDHDKKEISIYRKKRLVKPKK